MKLDDLSDHELLRGLVALRGTERRCVARMVAYLVEVEARRLHLADACPSIFAFCTRRLGMSEGEAFRRMTAARLARDFPSVLGRIERGEVHLSALALVAKHLTKENGETLLAEISGKSKLAVQELVAARFPRPDVPTSIRALPSRAGAPDVLQDLAPDAGAETSLSLLPNGVDLPSTSASAPTSRAASNAASNIPPTLPSTGPRGTLEPLTASRYKVQLTVSKDVRDKIERATLLMSHRNPNAELAVVLEKALDLLIADLEKSRLAKSKRPRSSGATPLGDSNPGYVTRAARRAAFHRDGEQCSFVNDAGERCPERGFLEVDHVLARALGGIGNDPANLRVLCRAHNRFVAEQVFGREHVAEQIRLRQRKSRSRRAGRVERDGVRTEARRPAPEPHPAIGEVPVPCNVEESSTERRRDQTETRAAGTGEAAPPEALSSEGGLTSPATRFFRASVLPTAQSAEAAWSARGARPARRSATAPSRCARADVTSLGSEPMESPRSVARAHDTNEDPEGAVRAQMTLGFRERESRRAVTDVCTRARSSNATMAIATVLREALRALAPA
jgi:RuvA, C-terminal domain